MCNIKLNVKLKAYSKGVIPNVNNFIEDAPEDDILYGRRNREWVKIYDPIDIKTLDNSGIELEKIDNIYNIKVKQETNTLNNINEYKEDYTYYIIDNTPDLYINGGTAYSDEEISFGYNINSGDSLTTQYELNLLPINSKGVFNG